jgi:hypothetical protein
MILTRVPLLLALACLRPAFADDTCTAPLFSCEAARGKFIRICSVEEAAGRRWSQIQYRFGPTEKPELVYPADSSKGASLLYFSHESKKGVYELTVRFTNGRFTYKVFSAADSRGEGGGGVTVSDQTGKLLTTIDCIERPYVFPAYLRRALACDMANPHGKVACAEKPYQVQDGGAARAPRH